MTTEKLSSDASIVNGHKQSRVHELMPWSYSDTTHRSHLSAEAAVRRDCSAATGDAGGQASIRRRAARVLPSPAR
jgi:hypothetical protein